MSEENLEMVRRAIGLWNSGDIDAWADEITDDVVWHPVGFLRDWLAPWRNYTVEIRRLIDAGDSFAMLTTQMGTDESGTEVPIELHAAEVIRDGKLAEMRWFGSEADALEAAGVSE